jgi:gentisate 1,2-dioxygenase
MVTAETAPGVREAFYRTIERHSMAPLWERLHALVPKQPASPALPVLWNWEEVVRPYLFQAGEIVSAAEAERRVLILENPGMPGKASATHSLYAGVQLVLPGEVARAHRHVQSALRFILEGSGAYTSVNGEPTLLHPGDFVLTPSLRWHDHGNDTDEPVVWLDGLDIPIISYFDAGFAEVWPTEQHPRTRAAGDSDQRFGNNLLPIDWQPGDRSSPILNYPYVRSRETLEALARGGDPDPWHGHKLRYVNPATGGAPMPTIGAYIQLLPAGLSTSPYRSTDGAVFVCVEGTGESQIGDQHFHWSRNDIFVVPSWATVTHRAAGDAVLFSFSDRPVQQLLGIWREDRIGETDR